MMRRVVPAALLGLAVLAAPAHAATTAPTYRQLAARECQAFFERTAEEDPTAGLTRRSWPRARREVAAALRRGARQSLRTDDRLAGIAHPRPIDAAWRRMVADDRAGARRLLSLAAEVERARTRAAGTRQLFTGLTRYDAPGSPTRRFTATAKALGLDGCVRLDPAADLGRDGHATRAQRAAARALGAAGARLERAVRRVAPGIARGLRGSEDLPCAPALRRAPERAQARLGQLLALVDTHAVFDPLQVDLGAFGTAVAAVPADDAALAAGRRLLVAFAAWAGALPPAPDVCATLADWRAHGWARSAAPAVPPSATPRFDGADADRTLLRFGRRLRALGISAHRVRLLAGDTLFDAVMQTAAAASRLRAPARTAG